MIHLTEMETGGLERPFCVMISGTPSPGVTPVGTYAFT
jgi:hypothetical protein